MLVGGRDCRTQFWKGITQGPFHQSLVSIGQVVSEENIFSKTEKVDEILIVFLLNYWANHGFKLC
jgi:hypothetical protein